MLIEEWRAVLLRAWSVRFNLIDAAFTGIAAGFYVFGDSLPHGVFFAISIFLSMASILARILWQPKLHCEDGP